MHIVDAVRQIRQMDPGIGYYKLWLMSKRMFLCDWVSGDRCLLAQRLLRTDEVSFQWVLKRYVIPLKEFTKSTME